MTEIILKDSSKEISGQDHRDLINMQIFGNRNKMDIARLQDKITTEHEVALPDGSKGIARTTVTFGNGQPQEPQFHLFSDLIQYWLDNIEDPENVNLQNTNERR